MATKLNLSVFQGSTFTEFIRYESDTIVYAPITAIPNTAPLTITSPSHGVVVGWRGKLSNIGGMTELNTTNYRTVTAVTTHTMTFGAINPVGYKPYTSGGIFTYNAPVSLSGMTGRLRVRASVSDTTLLDELTTENGGLDINDTAKTITINITATKTAAYTFRNAVYTLELISGSVITPITYGTFAVTSDLTC